MSRDHGARRRGDDADDARQERDRPFPRLVEQPLLRELLSARLQHRHKRAGAGGLQTFNDDLIFRLPRKGGDPPFGDHFEPFFRRRFQRLGDTLPNDAGNDGAVVL